MSDVTINSHVNEFLNSFHSKVETAMEAVGLHLEGESKEELENAPRRVDTGRLKGSITHTVESEGDKTFAIIGTNVSYSTYVHNGTRKMAPNRFLTNAVSRNQKQIGQFIKNSIN